MEKRVDLDLVVEATEGFSGRDLQTIVSRAARRAFAKGANIIYTEELLRQAEFLRKRY